jgi:hypothetical protein
MTRLRHNDISSLGTANPITLSSATTTTCSWTSAPSLPLSISWPDYAALVVEPDTANEEIVWLTGWTKGSTSGTVVRMAEPSPGGTATAIAHNATAWTHGPTSFDINPQGSADSGLAARTMLL